MCRGTFILLVRAQFPSALTPENAPFCVYKTMEGRVLLKRNTPTPVLPVSFWGVICQFCAARDFCWNKISLTVFSPQYYNYSGVCNQPGHDRVRLWPLSLRWHSFRWALTCPPPRNQRCHRSRSATLWGPWRTRPRRCWACPGRWGGQLPSPIPGNEKKKNRKKTWWWWGPTAWGIHQPVHVHLLTESGMKESQQVGETSGPLPLKEADGE